MSLCGKVVVVVKKKENRKRKQSDSYSSDGNTLDDDDDSNSPLQYTYTNCDSSEILQEMEQQQQLESPLMYYPSQSNNSTVRVDDDCDDDNDDTTLGVQRDPPEFRWLTWRMDPYKSFSDWMIDVCIEPRTNGTDASPPERPEQPAAQNLKLNHSGDNDRDNPGNTVTDTHPHHHHHHQQQRYHVHKNVLVVESQFFQTLFRLLPPTTGTTVTTASTATTVTAPFPPSTNSMELTLSNELEWQIFPTFLDYMYSPGSVWINPSNVSAMLRLAKFFRMRRLQWLCKQFLKLEESRRQQTELSQNVYTTAAMSPNVPSFTHGVTNLDHSAQATGTTTEAVPKDPPERIIIDASTTLLDPVPTTDVTTSTSRPLQLRSMTTANHHHHHHHHHHISTNSSTTTVSEHVTTTTKPSSGKSDDGVFD